MKKYWKSLLALASSTICFAQDPLTINQQTKKIYNRFYLINRLEKTISVITKSYTTNGIPCCTPIDVSTFSHPEVHHTAQTMMEQKKITPLKKLWKHFKTYRLIQDDLFEEEFIRLVLMLCYTLDQSHGTCKKENPITSADTNAIANTFYVIHRLEKPLEVLYQSCKNNQKIFDNSITRNSEKESFFEDTQILHHDRIQNCIHEIQSSESLEPIKRTHAELKQYRFAGDDIFLKEQLSLLFFAYKLMLNNKLSDQTEQVIMHEMETIQYVTQHIEEFSIDQILTAIDMMTDKLSTLNSLEKKNNKAFHATYIAVPLAIAAIATPIVYFYVRGKSS